MNDIPELVVKGTKNYKLGEYTVKILCLNLCLFRAYVYHEERLIFITDTFTTELEPTQLSFEYVKNITSLKTFLG